MIVLVESWDPTGSSTPCFGEGSRAAHYYPRWHKPGRIEVEHRECFQPQWPVGCYSVLMPCEAQLTDVTARRGAFEIAPKRRLTGTEAFVRYYARIRQTSLQPPGGEGRILRSLAMITTTMTLYRLLLRVFVPVRRGTYDRIALQINQDEPRRRKDLTAASYGIHRMIGCHCMLMTFFQPCLSSSSSFTHSRPTSWPRLILQTANASMHLLEAEIPLSRDSVSLWFDVRS